MWIHQVARNANNTAQICMVSTSICTVFRSFAERYAGIYSFLFVRYSLKGWSPFCRCKLLFELIVHDWMECVATRTFTFQEDQSIWSHLNRRSIIIFFITEINYSIVQNIPYSFYKMEIWQPYTDVVSRHKSGPGLPRPLNRDKADGMWGWGWLDSNMQIVSEK